MTNAIVKVDIVAAVTGAFKNATRQATAGLTVFKKQTQQLSAQQNVLRARMRNNRDQMSGMAREGMGFAAVGYAAAKAINPAIEFEQSMMDVLAATNEADGPLKKSSQAFADLERAALKGGATTEHTANAYARGMQKMSMAGFKAHEILAGIDGVMALATIGDVDAGVSSDIVSNILAGFEMAASQTNRVSDAMSQVITTANVDIAMLGETMKYVAPVAKEVGMSFEDAAATSGLLGNMGIQASNSGTALRKILSRMAGPPKEAADALGKLGIKTKDANGDLKHFHTLMSEVAAATRDMGSADRLGIFTDIFGLTALGSAAGLVKMADNGQLEGYADEVKKNMEGAAKRIQAVKLDSTKGDLTLLMSAISGTAIAVGTQLLPSIRAAAQQLTAMFSAVAQLATEYPGLTKVIVVSVASLLALKTAFFVARVAGLLFGGGILKSRLAVLAFRKSLIGAKFALAVFNRTTLFTRGAMFAGRAGVMAFRLAMLPFTLPVKLAARSLLFLGRVTRLNAVFMAAGSVAARAYGFAIRALAFAGRGVKAALMAVGAGIRAVTMAMLANPIGLAIMGIAYGASLIIRNWSSVNAWFTEMWQNVKAVFVGFKEFVVGVFTGDFGRAAEGIKAVWTGIKGWYQGLWDGIKGIFSAVLGDLDALLGAFVPDGVKSAWNGFSNWFNGIWTGLVPSFPDLSALGATAVQTIKSAWTGFSGWFTSLFAGILPSVDFSAIGSIAVTGIKTAWSGFSTWFSSLFSDLIPAVDFSAVGTTAVSGIKTAWNGFGTWFKSLFTGLIPSFDFSAIGSAAVTGIKSAWVGFSILSLIGLGADGSLGVDISSVLTAPFTAANTAIAAVFAGFGIARLLGFGEGFKFTLPDLSAAFKTALDGIKGVFTGFSISKLFGFGEGFKLELPDLKASVSAWATGLFDGVKMPKFDLTAASTAAYDTLVKPFTGIGEKVKGWFPEGLFTSWISGNNDSASAVSAHSEQLAQFSSSAVDAVSKLQQMGQVERNKVAFDAGKELAEANKAVSGSYADLRGIAFSGINNDEALAWIKQLEDGSKTIAEFQTALQDSSQTGSNQWSKDADALLEMSFALDENIKKVNSLKSTLENVASANAAAAGVPNPGSKPSAPSIPVPAAKPIAPPAPAISISEAAAINAKITEINTAANALPATVQTAMTAADTAVAGFDWTAQGTRLITTLNTGVSSNAGQMVATVTGAVQGAQAYLGSVSWQSHGAKIMTTLISGIKSKSGELKSTISGAFAESRRLMPSSDAKEGPFSSLTRSGSALMTTFGQGINKAGSGVLNKPLRKAFGEASNLMQVSSKFGTREAGMQAGPTNPIRLRGDFKPAMVSGGQGAQQSGGRAGGNTFSPNITINVNGGSGDGASIAEQVRQAVAEQMELFAGDVRSSLYDGA